MTWSPRPLSFRARLTLRWTFTVGLLLAVLSLVIYAGAVEYSRRDLDLQVRTFQENDLLAASMMTGQTHLFEDLSSTFHDFGYMPAYAQLLTLQGHVANATPSLLDAPPLLSPEVVQLAAQGRAPINDVYVAGRLMRVLGTPVERDGVPYVLATALSEAPMEQRLRPLVALLTSVWFGGVLATALAGFAIASRALKPVDQITRRAAAISRGDFGVRLDPPPVNDEIGRMTKLLNEVLERLQKAVDANRHFAADASHELRTPLTALQGEVDVALKRERPAAEYRETLEVVRAGLHHMTEITENLMVLVRAQERSSEKMISEVPLAPLIESIFDRARSLATTRGIALSSVGLQGVVLYGDGHLYARVFENLVANAVHYNRHLGAVTVTARDVEAASDEWAPDRIVVSVTDTGVGIPQDEWVRIFERFHRVETTRQRRRGAGLGLAICREVVTLYGGEIRVAASSPEGTTFEVDLPGRRTAPPMAARTDAAPPSGV